MKPMTLPISDETDQVPIAIFDLTIQDVNERREKRKVAESKTMAVRVLGLSCRTRLETIIRNRERYHWNGKPVAIRYEHSKFDKTPQTCKNRTSQTNPSTARS